MFLGMYTHIYVCMYTHDNNIYKHDYIMQINFHLVLNLKNAAVKCFLFKKIKHQSN